MAVRLIFVKWGFFSSGLRARFGCDGLRKFWFERNDEDVLPYTQAMRFTRSVYVIRWNSISVHRFGKSD